MVNHIKAFSVYIYSLKSVYFNLLCTVKEGAKQCNQQTKTGLIANGLNALGGLNVRKGLKVRRTKRMTGNKCPFEHQGVLFFYLQ